eukprot:scaffold47418_cov62-Phaeocystis_antarctica.AAC.2
MQEYVATGAKDGTGHTVYGDIGVFLRDTLNTYLKSSEAPPASRGGRTFYIDPSYIIRSVPYHPQRPHLLHPTLILIPILTLTLTLTLTLARCLSRPTTTSTARASPTTACTRRCAATRACAWAPSTTSSSSSSRSSSRAARRSSSSRAPPGRRACSRVRCPLYSRASAELESQATAWTFDQRRWRRRARATVDDCDRDGQRWKRKRTTH